MEVGGRLALVTGAGRRLGRALAVGLARRGMNVAVHYNGAERGARETVEEIVALGARGEMFPADLTRHGAPGALVRAVVARMGRLDVLVNSAAVMRRTPWREVTETEWDDMFALNLRAPFFLAQAAAVAMGEHGGAIVN